MKISITTLLVIAAALAAVGIYVYLQRRKAAAAPQSAVNTARTAGGTLAAASSSSGSVPFTRYTPPSNNSGPIIPEDGGVVGPNGPGSTGGSTSSGGFVGSPNISVGG